MGSLTLALWAYKHLPWGPKADLSALEIGTLEAELASEQTVHKCQLV